MKCDFSGYATVNDVLCSDGRMIKKGAFRNQDGEKVPLVWMHQRNEPENVLGHAYLENRDDGVYCYCNFNDSPRGKQAKLLVEHGDITSMSIYANNLVQKGSNVTHGMIREVSLVIAPANPGALIDNPVVQHGDAEYEDLTKAIITSGCDIEFGVEYDLEHADDKTSKWKKKKISDDEESEDEKDYEEDEEVDDESEEDYDDEEDEEDEDMDPKKKKRSMQHADEPDTKKKESVDKKEDDEETVQDVYDTLTEKQKKAVAYIIGVALSEQEDDEDEAEQSDEEGEDFMGRRNVFDQHDEMEMSDNTPALSHDQMSCIFEDAKQCGSLKQSFLAHAQEYGIENIDILFPDAKTIGDNPYMIKRPTEWVQGVLNATTHVPFNRVKSVAADLTADEARAKGYVKGAKKKEEVIKLLKRVTTPTTVYKKQKLDRDDIADITDLNVVAWLKAEMRIMLDEELARAFLIGDGREPEDPDKINEENIRPIWTDDDMYSHHVILDKDLEDDLLPEEFLKSQEEYKGSGNPVLYAPAPVVLKMLLLKDKIGRRLYNTEAELASAMGVKEIVKVPIMEKLTRETEDKKVELLGIIVNLRDYTVGATEGGQVSMFDDFDIDYNQYKYLIETRCCGTLTVPKSAIVVEKDTGEGVG